MEHIAYMILIAIVVILVVLYANLNAIQLRVEYPTARFCSNGVVFNNNLENKTIQYSNNYILKFVGADYFDSHLKYLNYTFNDCTIVVNYNYTVGNFSKIVFVKLYLPSKMLFLVKGSDIPRHPFEFNYLPSDFGINYTSYSISYDPELGFSYRFYYNNVPVGIGNAETGELQRIFNTL